MKSAEGAVAAVVDSLGASAKPTRLTRQQIVGFWATWLGNMLDGMDSVIYTLVLVPAISELLPPSGFAASASNVGFTGSILFALFLAGWSCSFIWGPIADRFGRTRAMAGTIIMYSVFTGLGALTQDIWQLAVCRFLVGVGLGGQWSNAGTYLAEVWPEERRVMGGGYLHTGSYFGFFVASLLNLTLGAHFGWRIMFLVGLAPIVVSLLILKRVREPERWQKTHAEALARGQPRRRSRLAVAFGPRYRRRTLVASSLVTIAIVGAWAAAYYEAAALSTLATQQGWTRAQAAQLASSGTAILAVSTICGCLLMPFVTNRLGRKGALALFFCLMLVCIPLVFGWAFYLPPPNAIPVTLALLIPLGVGGASFSVFTVWLPEMFDTDVRATAFAFCSSAGRMFAAGVNLVLAAAIRGTGTLGTPVACTAVVFALGMLIIPLAVETSGKPLPD